MNNQDSEKESVMDFFMRYLETDRAEDGPDADFFNCTDPGYSFGLPDSLRDLARKLDRDDLRNLALTLHYVEESGAWALKLFQEARADPKREKLQRARFARRVCDQCESDIIDDDFIRCYVEFDEAGKAVRPLFLCSKHQSSKRMVHVPFMNHELETEDGPVCLPDAPVVLYCQRCRHEWEQRKDTMPLQCPKCRSPKWNVPRSQNSDAGI